MTRKSAGFSFWLVVIVAIAVLTVPAFSSWRNISRAEAPPAPSMSEPDLGGAIKSLEFRNIGPATMGGRIDDYAVDENDTDTIYVGTAAGGVFKTTNGGTTWAADFRSRSQRIDWLHQYCAFFARHYLGRHRRSE